LGEKSCQDIMNAVIDNEKDGWKHLLSPKEWLCTCYIKEEYA